jgi:hypothetical protein
MWFYLIVSDYLKSSEMIIRSPLPFLLTLEPKSGYERQFIVKISLKSWEVDTVGALQPAARVPHSAVWV